MLLFIACILLLVLLRDIVALLFSTFACILLLVLLRDIVTLLFSIFACTLLRDIVTLPFFHFCLYIA